MQIREFQEMMKLIYFSRDSRRGASGTFERLVDEVHELDEAIKAGSQGEIMNEFADVLAWLASLANVVNIDLDIAALQKYNDKCPKCLHTPCNCPIQTS